MTLIDGGDDFMPKQSTPVIRSRSREPPASALRSRQRAYWETSGIHPTRTMQKSLIFGKFACRCPIKGSRLPQDMTETHSQNRRLGYARVSTYGQTLDAVGISAIRRATRAPG
ncbi:MAG TPA: hypothetical protein VGF39_15115 [Stellaceae bacterium]